MVLFVKIRKTLAKNRSVSSMEQEAGKQVPTYGTKGGNAVWVDATISSYAKNLRLFRLL